MHLDYNDCIGIISAHVTHNEIIGDDSLIMAGYGKTTRMDFNVHIT